MTTESNKPIKVWKYRGVRVAVFENRTGDEQVYHKTSLSRVYKEKETAAFKTTSSLGRDDVPIARHLLNLAWQFILDVESNKQEPQE